MDGAFDELIKVIVGIAGTALASLLVAVLMQAARKLGISIDADRQAQLEYFAKQAVLRVEEQAAAYLKQQGLQLKPIDKLRAAATEVMDRVPRVSQVEAQRIVESVLPQLGLGAAAGLRELGKAIATADEPATAPEPRPAA